MKRIKNTASDYSMNTIVWIICVVVLIVTAYPFYYSIVMSLSDGQDALQGGIYLWPRKFSLENYKAVLRIDYIYQAAVVSVLRTVIGTVCALLFTGVVAYALSHDDLYFRKFYMIMLIVTMYFSGGLIPYYMVIRSLGLMNNFLVYILPNLLNAFNAIIMIAFFREIPVSLEEAAKIDGAGYIRIFLRIIIPVSKPVLATIALFIAVAHWNAWTDAAFFITTKSLKTLSFVLISLINQTEAAAQLAATGVGTLGVKQAAVVGETLRPAAMMLTVLPILCVYPFLQKYFVKGIMLGSVKG